MAFLEEWGFFKNKLGCGSLGHVFCPRRHMYVRLMVCSRKGQLA